MNDRHYQEVCVTGPSSWPCCHDCARCFGYDPDPMRALPEYCPTRKGGDTASRTPFFVVKPPFRPLTAHEFDLVPRFAGSDDDPPPARVWDHNVIR